MKARVVRNGGGEIACPDSWDVFIEHRGVEFHIRPVAWTPAIEVRTVSEGVAVEPRTDNTVIVRSRQ